MQVKRFNWVQRPSAWQFAQAWKAQRSQMSQQFQAEASATANAFASAQNNMATGLSTLAAQASITRTQNQIASLKGSLLNLSA